MCFSFFIPFFNKSSRMFRKDCKKKRLSEVIQKNILTLKKYLRDNRSDILAEKNCEDLQGGIFIVNLYL